LWSKWLFWSKIKILAKHENFGQKSKFQSKMTSLVKNENFGQKSIFFVIYWLLSIAKKVQTELEDVKYLKGP